MVCLALVAFLSGVMSGFSGFGFSAVGAVSLVFLPAVLQVPLFQALSTGNQLVSVRQLREDMPKSLKDLLTGSGPFMLGGLAGAPVGIWLLAHMPPRSLMVAFGVLLTVYSLYSGFRPPSLKLRGLESPLWGTLVGLLGGVIGGFTAFPGAPVVVWIGLRGIRKARHRAILQPYLILSQIYGLGLIALLHPSYLNTHFWLLLVLCLPAVVPGSLTGLAIYKRTSSQEYRRALYLPLGISGLSLLVKVFGSAIMRLL